jgi:hypothetical protein
LLLPGVAADEAAMRTTEMAKIRIIELRL